MALAALSVHTAHADDDEEIPPGAEVDEVDEVIVIHDEQSPEAQRGLNDPAFVTVVRIDERAGETSSVAEVLAKSMGAYVRSLGGLGSFSSLSVRGGSSGHTAVLVDGVPLSRVATVSADIGRFQLNSFSDLELYRGGVPVELGGAAMGGALNLSTRVGPPADGARLRISSGGGSFGARHARARWLDGSADGATGYHLSIGYSGATGDFEFFDNRGTNLNLDDDRFTLRANNHFDQLDSVARYRRERGDLTVAGGVRLSWKRQGIPGGASVQATSASLSTLTPIADLSLTARRIGGRDSLTVTGKAFVSAERQHFLDLDSEVGLGSQDRRYRTLSTGLSGSLRFDIGSRQRVGLGVDGTLDRFAETDALRASEDELRLSGHRIGTAATGSYELTLARRAVLQLAARLDVLRTQPIQDSNAGVVDPEDLMPRFDVFPSPRATLRTRIADGLTVKGSAGRYFRAPTLLELFGDRGFVIGNPTLASETGLSTDLGLVFAPVRGVGIVDRVYVEFAGFLRRPRNTIVFTAGGGGVAVARNLGDARVEGIEASASLRVARMATVSANYTFLDTEQVDTLPSFEGKALPQRPRHQLYARVDINRRFGKRRAVLWSDITYVSDNYLDAASLVQVPVRRFIGAGVKFEPGGGLLIGLEGKNLANQRVESFPLSPAPAPELTEVPHAVADFAGFPLPGRALYLTVEWSP